MFGFSEKSDFKNRIIYSGKISMQNEGSVFSFVNNIHNEGRCQGCCGTFCATQSLEKAVLLHKYINTCP